MKFFYIIITTAFAMAMEGRASKVNKSSYFNYAVTLDSTYVTSSNSMNDFPDAFDSLANTQPDSVLSVVMLRQVDFPALDTVTR